MPVIDYTAIATSAQSQIEDAGLPITVTRSTVDSFDPALGYTVPGADIVATGYGVQPAYSARDIDGTVIKRGDMRLLIGPELAIVPEVGDTVTVDSVTWHIVNVDNLTPAGTDLLYTCQVRK